MKQKLPDILKAVFALGLTAVIIINYNTLSNLDVRTLINSAGSVAAAVFTVLGVYLLKSVVFVVPASLIYIAVGMAFDTKLALIVNCAGIMIEITATYIMGKILGKDAVTKKLSKTKAGEKLLNMQAKSQNLLIFTIRMSGLPIDFSSLFMGAFDFKFLPYFLFSLLGILPRVILFTIIGDRFYDLIPMKYIVTAVIIIIPLAAAYVIIKKIIDKKKAQSSENV